MFNIRYKKVFLLIPFVFLTFFLGIFTAKVSAAQISAPTILEAGILKNESGDENIYIKGLTNSNTEVLVYINGVYSGMAIINSAGTDTDSFYYKTEIVLPEESYIIKIIARDKTSLVLSIPAEISFPSELSFIPPAPTLVKPCEDDVIGKAKPFITGLTVNNTFVHVYIDGIYNGKTSVLTHKSGTANFAYKPFLNLSIGWHKAWTIAENTKGEKSKISNILNFKIEEPSVSPSLVAIEVNNSTLYDSPFITGLAKNNSLIRVFIDHELNGEFKVKNNESGTANFFYKPFLPLTRGGHLVYATAVDNRGKESKWSNVIYFSVKQPAIAQSAQEENIGAVAKIKESTIKTEEPIVEISEQGNLEKNIDNSGISTFLPSYSEEITDDDIKQLISEETQDEEVKSGLINETKENQTKIHLNLIIFIAFLFGVIAWIFWVNKELIKEKKALRSESDFKENIDNKNNKE